MVVSLFEILNVEFWVLNFQLMPISCFRSNSKPKIQNSKLLTNSFGVCQRKSSSMEELIKTVKTILTKNNNLRKEDKKINSICIRLINEFLTYGYCTPDENGDIKLTDKLISKALSDYICCDGQMDHMGEIYTNQRYIIISSDSNQHSIDLAKGKKEIKIKV